jgi:hypothetical protein
MTSLESGIDPEIHFVGEIPTYHPPRDAIRIVNIVPSSVKISIRQEPSLGKQ